MNERDFRQARPPFRAYKRLRLVRVLFFARAFISVMHPSCPIALHLLSNERSKSADDTNCNNLKLRLESEVLVARKDASALQPSRSMSLSLFGTHQDLHPSSLTLVAYVKSRLVKVVLLVARLFANALAPEAPMVLPLW